MSLNGTRFAQSFLLARNTFRLNEVSKLLQKSNQLPSTSHNVMGCVSICFLKKPDAVNTSKNFIYRNFSTSQLKLHQEKDEKIQNNEVDTTNIGEGTWQEVYSGVLTAQLKLLKMFSIGSSVIGLSMQPILYEKLGSANVAIAVTLASFLGFFTFITPALIHWVSKKYVTKLEYDPCTDVYAATTLSFFLKEKKVHFKVDDVIRPELPGMFTSFMVKNKPLFVDPSMFEDIDHYSRIMGYDKPIDFSMNRDANKRR